MFYLFSGLLVDNDDMFPIAIIYQSNVDNTDRAIEHIKLRIIEYMKSHTNVEGTIVAPSIQIITDETLVKLARYAQKKGLI